MRTMRFFFAAPMLASVLSLSAFAGDIHTGIGPQPDPPPATANGEMSTTADGIIHTGVAGYIPNGGGEAAADDESVVAAVLGLVQSVLPLL